MFCTQGILICLPVFGTNAHTSFTTQTLLSPIHTHLHTDHQFFYLLQTKVGLNCAILSILKFTAIYKKYVSVDLHIFSTSSSKHIPNTNMVRLKNDECITSSSGMEMASEGGEAASPCHSHTLSVYWL